MATLTRAELESYQTAFKSAEAIDTRRSFARPNSPRGLGAVALPRRIDIRPFPGRTRAERVAGWLIANVPRSASWSREAIDDLADRIALSSHVIE